MKRFSCIPLLLLLGSCTAYYLSTESLVQQMSRTHPQSKATLNIAPIVFTTVVQGNSLSRIEVLDRTGQTRVLPVNNNTGIRIFRTDGSHTRFRLNTLLLRDSVITGKKDHTFGFNIRPVHLGSVAKIEVLY